MSRFTPGDHLVTARLGYTHHGLYVGSGFDPIGPDTFSRLGL